MDIWRKIISHLFPESRSIYSNRQKHPEIPCFMIKNIKNKIETSTQPFLKLYIQTTTKTRNRLKNRLENQAALENLALSARVKKRRRTRPILSRDLELHWAIQIHTCHTAYTLPQIIQKTIYFGSILIQLFVFVSLTGSSCLL